MSHQALFIESVNLCTELKDCLATAEQDNKTLTLEKQALAKEKVALIKKAKELQDQVDNQVQLVKVAGANHIPMEKIASVSELLVSQGFLPEDKEEDFKQALSDQGIPALMNTLHKVASAAIVPHSYKDEGSLVMDKAAAAAGSTEELLSSDQKIWAKSFNIQVVN